MKQKYAQQNNLSISHCQAQLDHNEGIINTKLRTASEEKELAYNWLIYLAHNIGVVIFSIVLPGVRGTQTNFGYGCAAGNFDYHPIIIIIISIYKAH